MSPDFVKALLKLKAEIAPLTKNQDGYGYKYADLADVHRVIDEPLRKNGFVLYHEFSTANGQTYIDTHLIHEHGALASTLPLDVHELAKMNHYQVMGSAITYLRRYAIMALLGIPAEDDDGKSAAKPKVTPPAPPPKAAPKQKTAAEWDELAGRLYAKDSYYISVPTNGGDRPDYLKWSDWYASMALRAPSLTAFQKLQEDNAATLKFVRENCAQAVKTKVKNAEDKRLAFLQQQPAAAE